MQPDIPNGRFITQHKIVIFVEEDNDKKNNS